MTHDTTYRRLLSKMGYYNYQSGLIYRHINQEGGWESHLARCRSYIMKAVDKYKPEKVTVLGSGWLLEVPIAELIEKTGKICLVDIIHPPAVILQAGAVSKVELSENDLTGGLIEEVYQKTRNHSLFRKPDSLEGIVVPEYEAEGDPGMLISLNLITQLETMIVRYLKRKARISGEEMMNFRRIIQEKHISFLSKYRSVLITDYEEVITNTSGEVKRVSTLLAELPPAKDKEEWTWNFDSKGADYYSSRSIMRVLATII